MYQVFDFIFVLLKKQLVRAVQFLNYFLLHYSTRIIVMLFYGDHHIPADTMNNVSGSRHYANGWA